MLNDINRTIRNMLILSFKCPLEGYRSLDKTNVVIRRDVSPYNARTSNLSPLQQRGVKLI